MYFILSKSRVDFAQLIDFTGTFRICGGFLITNMILFSFLVHICIHIVYFHWGLFYLIFMPAPPTDFIVHMGLFRIFIETMRYFGGCRTNGMYECGVLVKGILFCMLGSVRATS